MLATIRNNRYLPVFSDEFFGGDLLKNFFDVEAGLSVPAVNIVETKDDYKIEVAAPGLNKDDLKIDLHNNLLQISCEKEDKQEVNDEKFMLKEFSYQSFKRSFTLPKSVDSEKIKATYLDGVLNISVPKREEAKEKPVRVIEIS
jgi:HSP20 family protein